MSFDVHQLVAAGRVTHFDVAPDGTWLAVEVGRADDEGAAYRSELWRVPLDGDAPTRIGRGAFHDGAPRFRADGALLFLSNRTTADHGDEDRADTDTHKQVWARLPDGTVHALTDQPLGVQAFDIPRGRSDRLFFMARRLPHIPEADQRTTAADRKKRGPSLLRYQTMPVRFWDHWLPEARAGFFVQHGAAPGGRVEPLTPDADREYENVAAWDASSDGSVLVTTRTRRGPLRVPMAAVEVFDVDAGTRATLARDDLWSAGAPVLSPDARTIAIARSRVDSTGTGPQHLHLLDRATGAGRDVAADWDRRPVPVAWLDAHRVLCSADDEGSVPLFVVDTRDGAVTRLTPEAGTHSDAARRGDRVFAIHHSLLDPPEVVSLPVAGGPTTRHTRLAGIDREALSEHVVVEHTTVQATDGLPIPLFVVRPREVHGPRPLLLWIHGGPRSQWGETWHWRWNSLIAACAGYVVGLPNPRGSTGLGQAWLDGIAGNTWGAQCYDDVMATADALVARDDVDPTRTCAMGGSFGGYMTNWIGTQTDRFTCLITHASVYSFHQFGWTTDMPAWWAIDLGTPWGDRAAYERYSPDMHLSGWRSPVLIIHGEKDYRVPIGEGLALFEGLDQRGVDAELAIFPDENHWILKPRNVVAWYELVLSYLDKQGVH